MGGVERYGAIVLGFFSFTEVPGGAHRAYNEWHQFDHLPMQFTLEGISFGQRWVCSPRCREARVAVGERLETCQYMTLYLMRDDGVVAPFRALGKELWEEGRFFKERKSHLSGPFEVVAQQAAPRVLVSGGAVPWRPATGIYVAVGAAVPEGQFLGVDGVAGEWDFAQSDGDLLVAVGFVDGDLWKASAQLGEVCLGWGTPLEWAGPLERVDPFAWDWFE
jgi:hypothetical protein